MKNMIRRTTLKVRDIQKSYDFYTEVLGMETYYNNEVTVKNDLLPGTKQGDKIHLIILKAQDPVIGMIGLLKPIDPEEYCWYSYTSFSSLVSLALRMSRIYTKRL